MSDEPTGARYLEALREFQSARWQADLERLRARLTGRSADLISFEDVRKRLKVSSPLRRSKPEEIPLDAIVGSVGRYRDFTRNFLPRTESAKSRWAQVRIANELAGLPPIEVYKIGDVYFVLDGNHRVSVAHQLGATHIEAYVSEIDTKAPLTPEDDLDDLIIKAEYAAFLEYTDLDKLRPDHDLTVTAPGQYERMMEMIDIHHYFMSRQAETKIPYEEAVIDWYDNIYTPAVQIIRERGMLRDFPGRTETDLYIWIARHQSELAEELGWIVDTEEAAQYLAEEHSTRPEKQAARLGDRLLRAVLPETLEPEPPPGAWRWERRPSRRNRLFRDILIAVTGEENGWQALKQAAIIAQREEGQIHGLHLVADEAERASERVRTLRHTFAQQLAEAGVQGDLRIDVCSKEINAVSQTLCDRARWADLAVIRLLHPPGSAPMGRISSGVAYMLRRCARPVLTVPGTATAMQHPLLAYDGSPKAKEALFVAAYLAGKWQIDLTVVGVLDGRKVSEDTLGDVYDYLQKHGVDPTIVRREGAIAPAILETAKTEACDFLILGGYGFTPMLEVVMGSTVDAVLRVTDLPTLVCR